MNNLSCLACGLSQIKGNGHTPLRKTELSVQNCGRQFVEASQRISAAERDLIKQLLPERLSLLGIRRVMKVSLRWLLSFIGELDEALPNDLNLKLPSQVAGQIQLVRLEANEMRGFVKR